MQVNQRQIEIKGQPMHFLYAGSGPPLLLLGGLLGGSFSWRFTMPALAARYTLYAMDLPGTGLSHDFGMDCSMSHQARRLGEFVRQMGWRGFGLIGSSFGGAIAMLLASQCIRTGINVRSLVLSSPVNPWSDFGQRRIRFLRSRFGGFLLRTVLPLSRPLHGLALRRMYCNPQLVTQEVIQGYRATILRRGRAQNILTALRNWRQDVRSLESAVPTLRIPTLLIWGTQDRAVDPRSATILMKRLPQAELKLIPGTGHLPFEEAPEEFNRIVLEFLAKAFPSLLQSESTS
jgi:pimeloyl-ACP methyl ester carboxylesterase